MKLNTVNNYSVVDCLEVFRVTDLKVASYRGDVSYRDLQIDVYGRPQTVTGKLQIVRN